MFIIAVLWAAFFVINFNIAMMIPLLPFIQSPNVVMQLIASNGVCWETRYGMPAFRNQPDQFRDK